MVVLFIFLKTHVTIWLPFVSKILSKLKHSGYPISYQIGVLMVMAIGRQNYRIKAVLMSHFCQKGFYMYSVARPKVSAYHQSRWLCNRSSWTKLWSLTHIMTANNASQICVLLVNCRWLNNNILNLTDET